MGYTFEVTGWVLHSDYINRKFKGVKYAQELHVNQCKEVDHYHEITFYAGESFWKAVWILWVLKSQDVGCAKFIWR